ncbi:RagB/SusD family nutrient uptake outer membrane protein [Saccharicrinis sp. FJH54]|uniref:RagB/SusD family nutrient uptake outer membrane protein n=1 Tax=Saccharicrinis sp. FJH54 TaxID=3344665 RepID=UPI0035D4BEAA
MKKNIIHSVIYTCLVIIATSLFSCQESFLEKPAGADITIDTVFASTNNAQQLIFSLYHDNYFGADNINLSWWDGYLSWSDIGEQMYVPNISDNQYMKYVNGTLSSATTQIYPLDYLFQAVRTCNTFIEKAASIPTTSSSEEEYIQRMLGEAHAHIAYQYFKGFRVWGSLPWINKRMEGGEEPVPRAAFGDMIDSMAYHLDLAATLLPRNWEDRWTGRFTKAAAKALKAKILVYAASPLYNGPTPDYAAGYEHPEVLGYGNVDDQRWTRAANACKEAIDEAEAAGHALYMAAGVEHNVYELAINHNDENIIYQTFGSYNSEGGWEYTHNMMNWPYGIGWYNRVDVTYQPTFQHVDGYQMRNGKFPISGYENGDGTKPIISDAGIAAGYNDQEYWKDRDPRFYQNIVYHGSEFGTSYNDKLINFDIDPNVPDRTHGDWPEFKTSFMVRKFVNEELGAGPSVVYTPVHPIIRLADLYLLYAESLSEANNGPTAEAIQYLNDIRSRSGMPGYDAANYQGSTEREKFHNAIKYERQVEFFLEGQRYFDLRRWKEGDELQLDMVGAVIEDGVVSRKKINWVDFFEDKYYFHPFYNDWVNNTPGLYQNPKY